MTITRETFISQMAAEAMRAMLINPNVFVPMSEQTRQKIAEDSAQLAIEFAAALDQALLLDGVYDDADRSN